MDKNESKGFFEKCKELAESPELAGGIFEEMLNILSRNTQTMKIQTIQQGEEVVLNMNDEERMFFILSDLYEKKIEELFSEQVHTMSDLFGLMLDPDSFEGKTDLVQLERIRVSFRNLMFGSINTRLKQGGKKISHAVGIRDNFIVVSVPSNKKKNNCPIHHQFSEKDHDIH